MQFELLKQKRFLPLFMVQFLGAFNDNFLKNALVILVVYHSVTVMGLPSSQIVALAGGIFILPFFLFSALAGQLADKFEKGGIIRWVKAIEIGIMALATSGLLSEKYGLLLVTLFLMGTHSTFFGPIKYSILPQHLEISELVTGNALIEASTYVAILVGTIAGGVLIAAPHGEWLVSLSLLAVAAIGFAASLSIPRAAPAAPGLVVQWNPVPPTLEMFRVARRTPFVYPAILAISWFWFFGAVMLSLFPPLCHDVLRGDEHLVTMLLAVFSIGIGAGSLLTARLSKGRLRLGFAVLGGFGLSLFSAALFWLCKQSVVAVSTPDFVLSMRGFAILSDLFLFAMMGGFFIVPLYTLMQQRSDLSECSRVIAANNVMNALFMVAASGILILLLRLELTIPQVLLLHAFVNLVVTAAMRLAMRGSVRPT